VVTLVLVTGLALTSQDRLPNAPLTLRSFSLQFSPGGTFALAGEGWPTMSGTWAVSGSDVTLQMVAGPDGCTTPGRYTFTVSSAGVTFAVVSDPCTPRRMILDRNTFLLPGVTVPRAERRITHTPLATDRPLPQAPSPSGSWPSFRGPGASGFADSQHLPERWDAGTGDGIRWRTPIPGLAHSSPVVWGDLVFVTTAVSSRANATFKPGLYGDGDASDDRSPQKWMLLAVDKRSGAIRWQRIAAEGQPRNARHIKSTYASASPATDGRIVVAWFGSEGVFAYDLTGALRWRVDLGRVDMGAYDIPSYEWGPASSPIIWNGLVIIQCDTQADSFLLALDAASGAIVWKAER
jgi:PQQ-like domain